MKRLYSQSTGTTYLQGFHNDIPSDAVEIDEARYLSVIANPQSGKVRAHDEHGLPTLIDPPDMSKELWLKAEQSWRDAELEGSQQLVARYRDELDMSLPTIITAEQFSELLRYRQQLWDWPNPALFPETPLRPVAPGWLQSALNR